MDRYDVGIMKFFRERDNKDPDEAKIGKIISLNPMKVSLFGGAAIFIENDDHTPLYVCEDLRKIIGTIEIEGNESKNFIITRELNNGDSVLCIPILNGHAYVAVKKV